jgi:hypothetical protein
VSRPIVCLLMLFVCTMLSAAPRGKEPQKGRLYFPTTVGEQWILGHDAEDGTNMDPMVVLSADESNGVMTVIAANIRKDGTVGQAMAWEVSEKGVFLVADKSVKLDPPQWLLKLPAKPGLKWEVPLTGTVEPVMVRTVAGEEKVETPAGTYQAIRIDAEYPAGKPWVTEWWAAGRGKVRVQSRFNAPLVLKSVTPAPAKK